VSPALAEAVRAIEAQFPGWVVSVNGLGHLYAESREPIGTAWVKYRPNLGAEDPAGLRAALTAFETCQRRGDGVNVAATTRKAATGRRGACASSGMTNSSSTL